MTQGWKRPLQLAGICWVVQAVLCVSAYYVPVVAWADGWAVEGFLNLQQPWLTHIARGVATLANPGPFVLWTVILAALAWRGQRPRHGLAAVILLVGASIASQLLKVLLAHERYHDFLHRAQIRPEAFPSGHATAAMSLAFAAILVAPSARRPVVAVAGGAFALLVSESIMLLGWHFPSDVAGGFTVATAFALMSVAALRAA